MGLRGESVCTSSTAGFSLHPSHWNPDTNSRLSLSGLASARLMWPSILGSEASDIAFPQAFFSRKTGSGRGNATL